MTYMIRALGHESGRTIDAAARVSGPDEFRNSRRPRTVMKGASAGGQPTHDCWECPT